jgi:hypothetical protein
LMAGIAAMLSRQGRQDRIAAEAAAVGD